MVMKLNSSAIMLITGSKQAGKKERLVLHFVILYFFDAEVSISFLCRTRDELYALMEFRGALLWGFYD